METRKAVSYERISSREQEQGYSLDAQAKERSDYARRHGLEVVRVWSATESAKDQGRKAFTEMVEFVKASPDVKVILVEKVDRLSRNFGDAHTILGLVNLNAIEVHFFHEGWTFHRKSPPSDYYRIGFMTTIATGHTYDLSDKVKKGMNEKAEQGEWPEKAPYGYRNDKATKLIEVDNERAFWVRRVKELSAVGMHSLERIRQMLIAEGYPMARHRLHINLIERIIRNPIYTGHYEWPKGSGTLIKGKHQPIVPWELHERAIRGLERFNKPKGRKRDFAYAGLIRCGLCPDQRAVVFEIKKGRFIYGHCSGVRKAHLCPESEYVRIETLEEQFLAALKGVQLTKEIADFIIAELAIDSGEEATSKITQLALMKQEIGRLESRIRQAYTDKLDGKIDELLWTEKNREWNAERVSLQEKMKELEASGPASYLPTARKVLELSNRLESLYFSANQAERRELLDTVCSNLFLRGKNIAFTYRKPFDLWAEGLSSTKWLRD